MKITRLKRGYRIRLSDGEFDAITALLSLGEAYMEGMGDVEREETERDIGRAALAKITAPGAWAISEDRRAS